MEVTIFGANPCSHLVQLGDWRAGSELNCRCQLFPATKILICTADAKVGRGRGITQVEVRHERF